MMVKNSKRPINIKIDDSHLAASGSALHEYAGPYAPNAGPVFPMLEKTTPTASINGNPSASMMRMLRKLMKINNMVNAKTVKRNVGAIAC